MSRRTSGWTWWLFAVWAVVFLVWGVVRLVRGDGIGWVVVVGALVMLGGLVWMNRDDRPGQQ